MTDSPIKDVADTAFWIAYLRGVESQRPGALFRDQYAARLAGEAGREMATHMPMSRLIAWSVAIRTCIVDDYIGAAIRDGIDTVLNLGAGLDARPYRMELPSSLRWIEADYPRIIEHKEKYLDDAKPRCSIERVKIDLADLPARRAFLSRVNASARKFLILTEGVVPYLSNHEAASLADDLRTLDRASYWIVDHFSADAIKFRRRSGMTQAMQRAPFKFAPVEWFAFFQEHGWKKSNIRYLVDEGERLGRPIPLPPLAKWITKITMKFAPKERRDALRKFSGYVMLVPA